MKFSLISLILLATVRTDLFPEYMDKSRGTISMAASGLSNRCIDLSHINRFVWIQTHMANVTAAIIECDLFLVRGNLLEHAKHLDCVCFGVLGRFIRWFMLREYIQSNYSRSASRISKLWNGRYNGWRVVWCCRCWITCNSNT